jgi:hypothetical protein
MFEKAHCKLQVVLQDVFTKNQRGFDTAPLQPRFRPNKKKSRVSPKALKTMPSLS